MTNNPLNLIKYKRKLNLQFIANYSNCNLSLFLYKINEMIKTNNLKKIIFNLNFFLLC